MAPYKFRYYQPEEYEGGRRSNEVAPRRVVQDSDYKYGRKYEKPSFTGSDSASYTASGSTPSIFRSVTPEPRGDARERRRRRDAQPRQYDHHNAHIHYISPRSEPPVKYGAPQGRPSQEMVMLKSRANSLNEPRITLLANRNPKRKRRSHSDYHACPQKSSKAIPSMHYDELRCPQCAAHIQVSQDEVLAYPWTVQSYRPNRYQNGETEKWQVRDKRISLEEIQLPAMSETKGKNSLPDAASGVTQARSYRTLSEDNQDSQTAVKKTNSKQPNPVGARQGAAAAQDARSVGDFTDYAQMARTRNVRSSSLNRAHQLPVRMRAPLTPVTRRPLSPVTKQPLSPVNGQTNSRGPRDDQYTTVNTVRPMFRPQNAAPVRSDYRTNAMSNKPYLGQSVDRYDGRRFDGISTVREDDDVTPLDSISNVMMPPMRVTERESIYNRQPVRIRADTEVDNSYTRRKFFQSLDREEPPQKVGMLTPRPKKDTASEISRMLKGEYYDRRAGRMYEYNINFAPRRVHGERHTGR